MRLIPATALSFLICCRVFAQSEHLPDILIPDEVSKHEAQVRGGKVFKLLPFETFKDLPGSFSDKDNPIGIRGGGSFYSFLTESHSYNKVPQLGSDPGLNRLYVAADFGFLIDLGDRDLFALAPTSAEVEYFITYKPPHLLKDYAQERKRLEGVALGTQKLGRVQPAVAGHTYLQRVVSWDRTDLVIGFQIFKRNSDNSLIIIWRKMAELPIPHAR